MFGSEDTTIGLLLRAIAHGDEPVYPIERVLLFVRHLVETHGNVKSPVWITEQKDDPVEQSIFFLPSQGETCLCRLSFGVPMDVEGMSDPALHWSERIAQAESHLAELRPTQSIPAQITTAGGDDRTIAYCQIAAASAPQFNRELSLSLGGAFHRVRYERCVSILRESMERARAKIIEPASADPVTKFDALLDEVSRALSAAFPRLQTLLVARDVAAWRSREKRGADSIVLKQSSRCAASQFDEATSSKIRSTVSAKLAGLESAFFSREEVGEHFLPPEDELVASFGSASSACVYLRAVKLHAPRAVNPQDGLPFIGVIFLLGDDVHLTRPECKAIGYYLRAVAQVYCMLQRSSLDDAEDALARSFGDLNSAEMVAQKVAEFLSEWFAATEVAVLESRGNFLSVIAAQQVPLDKLPPLHVDGESIVSEVARTGERKYADNVKDKTKYPEYLEVIEATRTQWTIPLEWSAERVGCLLIGVGVIDGLTDSDRATIEALAAHCAQAISSIRDASEIRAILHRLKDNLPTVLSKLKMAKRTAPGTDRQQSLIDQAIKLLTVTRNFVNEFVVIEVAQATTFDLLDSVEAWVVENEDLLCHEEADESQDRTKIVIASRPDLRSLTVTAKEPALHLSLGHIMRNAIEAMRSFADGAMEHVVEVSISEESEYNQPLDRTIDFAVVSVRDNGPGLTADDEEHVVDLFYSHYSGDDHLGGGINIAKRAMASFGGKLKFKNNGNNLPGATFSLWLPLSN